MGLAVTPALLIAALWFRAAVAVPPLNETTVGSLWQYDYNAAVNAAAVFGFVRNAPPDRLNLSPATDPVPLTEIARSFEPVKLDEPPYPTTFRMPGYSLASVLAMLVTGTTSIQPLIDLQLVLDSLVPVFTFLILRRLTNRGCALVGGVLSVVWLPEAASASVYYATAPIPFLLTLSLWLYVGAVRHASLLRMALFGGVWLVIAFLRAELVLIPPLLSAFALILPLGARRILPFVLTPAIILSAGLAAWMVRNYVTLGQFSLTSQVGATLWEGMGYGSNLFPEYKGLYNDAAVPELLTSRGIVLPPAAGTFFDGPMGMEANRALLTLFWTEVVRQRPVDLALHFAHKLRENYGNLHNWQSALIEFGHERRVRLAVVAAWIDLLMQVLPWVAVVLIPWRDPRERILAAPLICLLGLHLALMIMVAGPLRYTAGLSPCYPLLIGVVLWLIAGRVRSQDDRPALEPAWIPLTVGIVLATFVWWRSTTWPQAPGHELLLDLRLMPAQTAAQVTISPLGVTLRPATSATHDVNLAAKRPVVFYSAPNYPGITGPDDVAQLTDGVVQADGDHQSPGWVGWGMHAPRVFIGVPLDRPTFVSQIRIHALQGAFPLAGVLVWEAQGDARFLVSSMALAPSAARTAWLSIPVNQRLGQPIIELNPSNVNDSYIFIDEIELLASEEYEVAGEFVSEPIRLRGGGRGRPTLVGDLPPHTSAELWYRRAGSAGWHAAGWDARYTAGPVQFRILLRASPDRRWAPSVSGIRLVER